MKPDSMVTCSDPAKQVLPTLEEVEVGVETVKGWLTESSCRREPVAVPKVMKPVPTPR